MISEQTQNINEQNYDFRFGVEEGGTKSFKLSGDLLFIYRDSTAKLRAIESRGDVRSFSPDSGRRMRSYLRECRAKYITMVTLTYPQGHGYEGGSAKRDLKVFIQWLKRACPQNERKVFSVFWFMEFQDRGAIHFHLLTTAFIHKDRVAHRWYEIVGSEDDRHLRAGTRVEAIRLGKKGMCSYASKYAAKQSQKVPPDEFGWVGRFWGVAGYREREAAVLTLCDENIGYEPVQRHIEDLYLDIEDGVFSGKCSVVPTADPTFLIISIKYDEFREQIRRHLWLARLQQSLQDVEIEGYDDLLDDLREDLCL